VAEGRAEFRMTDGSPRGLNVGLKAWNKVRKTRTESEGPKRDLKDRSRSPKVGAKGGVGGRSPTERSKGGGGVRKK
jgi:hypothetical protein